VHLQCPRSCDCNVPIGKLMGTSQIFPKKVPVMFLSGSFKEFFAVSPVMGLQCSQPVKFKMSQNGVPEMTQSGTFRMYPSGPPQYTTFGKNPGHFGNTARKCLENWKTGNILNEPNIFPKCPGFLPKVVYWGGPDGYILNVPLWVISGTPFWLIFNFTGWEHCNPIIGDTAKKLFE